MLSKIDRSNTNGNQILQAVDMIRTGLAKLNALNGVRLHANAVSTEEFEAVFGVTAGGGSDLSTRWGALLAWKDSDTPLTSAVLNDFINTVVSS